MIAYWLGTYLGATLSLAVVITLSFASASLRRIIYASIEGMTAGISAGFFAFAVALVIVRHASISESWALFVGFALPAIGELQDFIHRFRIASGEGHVEGWPGRLHLMVRVNAEHKGFLHGLTSLGIPPNTPIPEIPAEEGRMAFGYAQRYISHMCWASFIGVLTGLFLAAKWLRFSLAAHH